MILCANQPLLLQVNPLAEDAEGRLIAADAKLGFDDSAGYRQKDTFAMRDESQLDPRCGQFVVSAHDYPDLIYVSSIGLGRRTLSQ
jgi:succinyl-CoA synthetase beta subunit